MMITWKRAAGVPDGVDVCYRGTSSFLVSYEVHSMRDGAGSGRRFRTFRVMPGGRLRPAAEGGEHRHLWAAQGCAETDLRQVLRSPCGVLIRPLAPVAEIVLHERSESGYRRQFRPVEGLHYFPADEPLLDLFTFEPGLLLACPCGAYEIDLHDRTFSEAREAAQWHIDDKHRGR